MKIFKLKENVKEKVVKDFQESEAWNSLVGENFADFMETRFHKLIGEDLGLELRYSLNHCQGDEVSFVGKIMCTKLETLPFGHLFKDIDDSSILFTGNGLENYYCHDKTVDIEIDIDEEIYSEEELNILEKTVQEWFENICSTLEKEGYEILAKHLSEEVIIEYLAQYDFDENGEVI